MVLRTLNVRTSSPAAQKSPRTAFVGRAALVSLSSLLPNLRTFVILLVINNYYGPEIRSTVGLTGTFYGLIFILGIGFSIQTVHTSSHAIREKGSFSEARQQIAVLVERELIIAMAASIFLIAVSIALWFTLPTLININPRMFHIYWVCFFPSIAIIPISLVVNGALQAAHRDKANLVAAVLNLAVQGLLATLAVLLNASPDVLVVVLGLASSTSAIWGVVFRVARLRSLDIDVSGMLLRSLFMFLRKPVAALGKVPSRMAGSVDGLAFMTTFTIANVVAVRNSVTDGAILAISLALMRALIVPIKQFGIVGGRLVAQGRRGTDPALGQADVLIVCSMIMAILAIIVILIKLLSTGFSQVPWIIISLMVAELLMEPFSGTLYAFLKIVRSPKACLPALFFSYAVVGIPGLLVISFAHMGTATIVWTWLFFTRFLFMIGVLCVTFLKRQVADISSSQAF